MNNKPRELALAMSLYITAKIGNEAKIIAEVMKLNASDRAAYGRALDYYINLER